MADFSSLFDTGRRVSAWLLTMGLCAMAGCQQPAPANQVGAVPTYNTDSGRLERISYDRDKDGKPDAWLFMDGTRATRAELDENHDGRVDRWEHYGAALTPVSGGTAPRGEMVRAEQDTRFDGKVSRWETYEAGQLAKVEEDTTGDGRADKWETWKDGSLVEVALDTKGTGKPDRRLVYPSGGGSPQLLVDATGEGVFRPVTTEP